jgi:hypothetical protein
VHIQPKDIRKRRRKAVRFSLRALPPENSRWGSAVGGECVSYLVRHHRASLWLCSFSEACMKTASLHPRVTLPETSLWRERVRAPQPQLDLDGLLCGTRCVAASDNLCGEPHSSSLQHLSSSNYGFLGSTTYSSLGSNETVLAASVVLGFLWSGGGRAHNYQRLPPCSYSAALRQHPLLRHLQFSLLLQHY